jgi:Fe-S cluster assembly protein SufD
MLLTLLEQPSSQSFLSDLQMKAKKKALSKTISLKGISLEHFEGISSEGFSFSVEGEGVELLSLDQALQKYGLFLKNRFEKMLVKEEGFFSLFNRGCSDQVFCLFVHHSTPLIKIAQHYINNKKFFSPRIQIFVGKGVKTTFFHTMEVQGKDNCINSCIDIALEREAQVSFFETGTIDHDNDLFLDTKVTVKQGGCFTHTTGTLGSRSFKSEISAYLLEKGAKSHLQGFWNGSKDADISFIAHTSHLAYEATSREHYQGVCHDKARASFEGQIYVDKVAQKTDSYQLSKHLLIGEKASGFSKPNLEVFADDVKASHGATVSMIDEEALFYLMSRGISKQGAIDLVKRAFLAFFLNEIGEKEIYKSFLRLIDQ